jgi:hypothetical protein
MPEYAYRFAFTRAAARVTRFPDMSMTSVAMGFFAANMERKLRLLFALLFDGLWITIRTCIVKSFSLAFHKNASHSANPLDTYKPSPPLNKGRRFML